MAATVLLREVSAPIVGDDTCKAYIEAGAALKAKLDTANTNIRDAREFLKTISKCEPVK